MELRRRPFTPHAVAIAIEVMRIGRQNPDVIKRDIRAGEIWRIRRYTDIRVGRVTAWAIVRA